MSSEQKQQARPIQKLFQKGAKRRKESRHLLLSPSVQGKGPEMHTAVQLQEGSGKLIGQSSSAADGTCPKPCRLFVRTDRSTKIRYLIDTGSDVSVYPRSLVRIRRWADSRELFAANGSNIKTYEDLTMQPDLGLRRAFPWRFVVADVTTPIIGSDFLAHFHLLPDVKEGHLVNVKTALKANRTENKDTMPSVKAVMEDTPFHQILARFPGVTRTTGTHRTVGQNGNLAGQKSIFED
ncbi:uncharacterized protein LOC143902084 [Temnothorax americanus]|uniref:uncharacterized protein LOC143902084 n=1 Tax=Temnothorax americanus TaxID=1964332 RepID=UPI0040680A4F